MRSGHRASDPTCPKTVPGRSVCVGLRRKSDCAADRSWGVVASSFVLADGAWAWTTPREVFADFGTNVRPQEAVRFSHCPRPRRVGRGIPTTRRRLGATWARARPPPGLATRLPVLPAADRCHRGGERFRGVVPYTYACPRTPMRCRSGSRSTPRNSQPWVCHQYNDYFVALLASAANNPQMKAATSRSMDQGQPHQCEHRVVGSLSTAGGRRDAVWVFAPATRRLRATDSGRAETSPEGTARRGGWKPRRRWCRVSSSSFCSRSGTQAITRRGRRY